MFLNFHRPRSCVLRPRICGLITQRILLRKVSKQPCLQPFKALTQPCQASWHSLSNRVSLIQLLQLLSNPTVSMWILTMTMNWPLDWLQKEHVSINQVVNNGSMYYTTTCFQNRSFLYPLLNNAISYHTQYNQSSYDGDTKSIKYHLHKVVVTYTG